MIVSFFILESLEPMVNRKLFFFRPGRALHKSDGFPVQRGVLQETELVCLHPRRMLSDQTSPWPVFFGGWVAFSSLRGPGDGGGGGMTDAKH